MDMIKSPFDGYGQNDSLHGDDNGILKHMREIYNETQPIFQTFWDQAELDTRFKSGDSTAWRAIYQTPSYARKFPFQFNWLLRLINMVSGYQRKNRKSSIVLPADGVTSSMERNETASDLGASLRWVKNRDKTDFKFSDGFELAAVTGMNLMGVYMDYSGTDPINGNICTKNIGYSGFLLDPYFKDLSLADCDFVWERAFLKKNQILSIVPDKKALIDEIKPRAGMDSKFIYMPENYNNPQGNLYALDQFTYQTTRKADFVVDIVTGETIEWEGTNDQFFYFKKIFPNAELMECELQTVKLCLSVNDHVIYHGRHPLSIDVFPYILQNIYFNTYSIDYSQRFQGVVRGLRDSQYLYNHRKIIEFKSLESQIQSGLKMKQGALVDPNDAFKANTGEVLLLKPTAQMTDVERIAPPMIDPTVVAMSKGLAEDIPALAGISENLMGLDPGDQSGLQTALRQAAAATTLQPIFDKLDMNQMQLDDIILRVIQKNFSYGKIQQILGREPSQEFFNKSFRQYQCIVEEGAYTVTQKQNQFMQLVTLKKELGIPISSKRFIDAAPLINKNDILDDIMEEEKQAAEVQKQQTELQLQQMQMQNALAEATVFEKRGLGAERFSRIEENQALSVERIEQAKKESSMSALNEVKAAKELVDMDLSQLQKLIDIVQALQNNQARPDLENKVVTNVQAETSPEVS